MNARILALLTGFLLLVPACRKSPEDAQIARLASILSKRIASVSNYDISWITTRTILAADTGTTASIGRAMERTAFKSGKYLSGIDGRTYTGEIRGALFKDLLGSVEKRFTGRRTPFPNGDALGSIRYWAMLLSLPKAVPTDSIYREAYDLSVLLANNRFKSLDGPDVADGHRCLKLESTWQVVWVDAEMLVVRRTVAKIRGQPIGLTVCLSDYRPLKGTLLSIPWRIETRIYGFDSSKPASLTSRRLESVTYMTVIEARANGDVSDLIFSKRAFSRREIIPVQVTPLNQDGTPDAKIGAKSSPPGR